MTELNLFGEETPKEYTRPNGKKGKINQRAVEAHAKLISLYGKRENEKCKNCDHLGRRSMGNTYYKCTKFSISHSGATDWRVNWQACGLFKNEETK